MAIIVCDLDGVLADSSERIGKAILPDGSIDPDLIDLNILDDKPRTDVIGAVTWLVEASKMSLEIWTARPDRTRADTEAWLAKHQIRYDKLRMAPKFTNLQDAVDLKRGWTKEVGINSVAVAIDDRIEMIEMYKEEGVPRVWHVI